MSELHWIEWKHGHCPVPPETMVHRRYTENSCMIGHGALEAEAVTWRFITYFAIDPDQPAQLGGPLEVGASYVCRDGTIAVVTRKPNSKNGCGYVASDFYMDPMTGAVKGEFNHPKSFVARLYLPTEPAASVVTVPAHSFSPGQTVTISGIGEHDGVYYNQYRGTFSGPEVPTSRPFVESLRDDPAICERAEYDAWLARAEEKCRHVRELNKAVNHLASLGDKRQRNMPTSFGVACNFDTTRGHMLGRDWSE